MTDLVYKAMNVVWKGCVGVGLVAAAAAFALFYFQDNILYIPDPDKRMPKLTTHNPPHYRSPAEYTVRGNYKSKSSTEQTIPYIEDFVTTTDGEKIHVWLMYHQNVTWAVPTLIYFHGNAANMGYRLPNAALMYGSIGINILMMDYRGYGLSSGTPSEKGLNLDAEAVLSYAKQHEKLAGSPIILFGRSLGGAVALSLHHSNRNQISAIIAENTFLSISSMVDALLPIVSYFGVVKDLLLRLDWNNAKRVVDVAVPILFIAGALDEIVPPSHMRKLYDLAQQSSKKEFYLILGGHHNDCFEVAGRKYYEKIKDFVESNGLMNTPILAQGDPKASSVTCDTKEKEKFLYSEEISENVGMTSASSEDDFVKINEDGVEEGSEAFAIPSINTKYKSMHL